MTKIRNLIKNNKGATAIEYGLIAALIAVAAITAVRKKSNYPPPQSSITIVVCHRCHLLLSPSLPSKKNHYYYLAPLISAMNKGFLESIDLICNQLNLML